jgi:hypothetical protein
MNYRVEITGEELNILNQALDQYIMDQETKEGPQSEIDKIEGLQKKLNRERNIIQDLMEASRRG